MKELVLIHGKFNVLHPGHINLFKIAKKLAKKIVIGLYHDDFDKIGIYISEKNRIQSLKHVNLIDEVELINTSLKNYILKLKPDIILKGSEFSNIHNEEQEYINKINCKLVFMNTNSEISSYYYKNISNHYFELPRDFMKRHKINNNDIIKILNKTNQKKILIIGDTIVDEFNYLKLEGLSREDSNLVYFPVSQNRTVGGAGIIALHAKYMNCKSYLLSILGEDKNKKFIEKKLKKENIKYKFFDDASKNTLVKQRFIKDNKIVFRLNIFDRKIQSNETYKKITNYLSRNISKFDIILVADFNYGVITSRLYEFILKKINFNKQILTVDSQSSSQIGNLNKFKNPDFILPTEYEARFATHDNYSGLPVLSQKLKEIVRTNNIIIKLGSRGVYINSFVKNQNVIIEDEIPSLNSNPNNISGAGDSFHLGCALTYSLSKNIWLSALIGSMVAAIQVSKNSNEPVSKSEVKKFFRL